MISVNNRGKEVIDFGYNSVGDSIFIETHDQSPLQLN